jgi:hypothetical protein
MRKLNFLRLQYTVLCLLISSALGCAPESRVDDAARAINPAEAEKQPLASCSVGTPIAGRTTVKSAEVPLLAEPKKGAKVVLNERASEIFGRPEERRVSGAYALQMLCRSGDYTLVKIVGADGRPVDYESGWVENKQLAISGEKVNTFSWDLKTGDALSAIEESATQTSVDKILATNTNCAQIIYGARSTQDKNKFFITCSAKNGGEDFNVWFSVADVNSGLPIGPSTPVSAGIGRELCNKAIRSNALFPSTVEIDDLTGFTTKEYNNGNRQILQTFSARAASNLLLRYEADCLITPKGSVEISISERGS